jgi:carbamoyltransferase
MFYGMSNWSSLGKLPMRLRRKKSIESLLPSIAHAFGADVAELKSKMCFVEHHKAHLASAFLVSPFAESAVLSIDGFGDFVSCMLAHGKGTRINILRTTFFPHSLGLVYTAVTQLLGFMKYGDEFKVMGLAPYGKPTYTGALKDVIRYESNGSYELDLSYFIHHSKGVNLTWENGEPAMGEVYSERFSERFGPQRPWDAPLTDHHRNLAASIQQHTEEIIFSLLRHLYDLTGSDNVCLAGGVAMNSVANGKVCSETPFRNLYVQSAAGDAGTSLGAAFYLYNSLLGNDRSFVMESSAWGPQFDNEEISSVLDGYADELAGIERTTIADTDTLCMTTAQHIADGKVVGWFQGPMEWGARALGNRSILADPRNPRMKDILNARIKKREPFRPFAPSVPEERVSEYFETDCRDPFMTRVIPIRKEKRPLLPAVTHVDGTGRIQTVSKEHNPIYWQLINAFERVSGVPIVLNTSFNENEPIVCHPKEAIECFLRTKMDVLVLENTVLERRNNTSARPLDHDRLAGTETSY